MPNAAASVLADLAPLLEELGVRWYLFGAQAAIHYGSPRSTADVDVTVELGELRVETLVDRLRAIGIVSRFDIDEAFIAQTRVLPMQHTASGMGVDLVIAGPGPERTFLERAVLTQFSGVPVRVASPTDIIIMKVLAGRPKDLDDIVGMLRAAPEGLDFGEARALIVELAEMLGELDLVRVIDEAATAAGVCISGPE